MSFVRYQAAKLLSYRLQGSLTSEHLRVLLLHEVPPTHHKTAYNLFLNLQETFQFIQPSDLALVLSGQLKFDKPPILLTFDDGSSSLLQLTAQVLNPLGITPLHFINPLLIELQSESLLTPYQTRQALRNPHLSSNLLTWNNINYLQSIGHGISDHGSFHHHLPTLTPSDLLDDITISTSLLNQRLHQPYLQFYAYSFGSYSDLPHSHIPAILSSYHLIFSGLRGTIKIPSPTRILPRVSLNLDDPLNFNLSLVYGCFDILYKSKLNHLNALYPP